MAIAERRIGLIFAAFLLLLLIAATRTLYLAGVRGSALRKAASTSAPPTPAAREPRARAEPPRAGAREGPDTRRGRDGATGMRGRSTNVRTGAATPAALARTGRPRREAGAGASAAARDVTARPLTRAFARLAGGPSRRGDCARPRQPRA